MRTLIALMLIVSASACAAKAPPAPVVVDLPPPPPEPPSPSLAVKRSWIVRLEDQRVLREPPPADSTIDPAFVPNLLPLLADADASLRRRAALAAGRVGEREGVEPLIALLKDGEPEVRQMAAFSLGLIADVRARDPLIALLDDQVAGVRASAAEALGLIGDTAAAPAIGRMIREILETAVAPEGETEPERDTPLGAVRLGIFALARLKAYEPLAAAVLDAGGAPRLRWWPIAYGFQRIEDARALPALGVLAREAHPYTRAFAVKGLGGLKDRSAVTLLTSLLADTDLFTAVEAIRALGRIGDPATADALFDVIFTAKPNPMLRLEAVSALGGLTGSRVVDALVELLPDRDPLIRAAALRALAQVDGQTFIAILSGFDQDSQWQVRVALAQALAVLPSEAGLPRLRMMLGDEDQRVVPAVLAGLARLGAPEIEQVLLERLKADDFVVRMAAAQVLGELKPEHGLPALEAAYEFGQRDLAYVARAGALSAAAAYGGPEAVELLTKALEDRDWAVRLRAASLLTSINSATDAASRIRPAPSYVARELYDAPRIVAPTVSTQAYIETDRGNIQIELAVVDAPLTVENFVTLARRGFFDGLTVHRVVPNFVIQTGDPRSDSEGGPGFTIRDELNQRPYLRGTVGMALDWADTGGSQFFITHSPQPHLDARYTAFGRVISGIEVVDQLQQGDVIRRIRIWDGVTE